MSPEAIRVEVIYALPERVWLLPLRLPAGSTAGEAIERSGIRAQVPDIEISEQRVGVFGKPCRFDTVLRDGDRVELYRVLLCDPKQVRRERAEAGRAERPPTQRRG
jgi:uncharacterized protein